jgi:hypothetical protein
MDFLRQNNVDIDFQGQRSRAQGLIFRRGDTPCFALPLFLHIC